MSCQAIAGAVGRGTLSAVKITRQAIERIRAEDGKYGAVTRLLDQRALAEAEAVDAKVARGEDPGPLAGVVYGVKDLFDVEGLATTAGAAMRRNARPATRDAEAIRRFQAAGAILVATLNMDEFAYGFATINAAYGTTRNPHDTERLSGGSSGGSAAAVASGMLPLALGSDTNGSIRVPAALCGLYGLKPTHGTLPMGGVFPFVDSFDDIGPFADSVGDLRLAWEVLKGEATPTEAPSGGNRVAKLGGWFAENVDPEITQAIDAIGNFPTVELPEVSRARSAAFIMTAFEGGGRHFQQLRHRAMEFDPQVRDRLLAGALLPAAAYFTAERFRAWFRARADALFERYDVLIAPATTEAAPRIDDPNVTIGGQRVPARAHLGILTQPLSFIGLPVISVPLKRPGKLPLGLQLVGKPGGENTLFDFAERLEADGVIDTSRPRARV